MVTDRISLNLAYLYLRDFEAVNVGKIDQIVFRKTMYDYPGSKLETSFTSLNDFKYWIDLNAPLIPFDDLECFPLSIYELIKVNIVSDITDKNTIVNNNHRFETASGNINSASVDVTLNQNYMQNFLKVLNQFNQFKLDEYILIQRDYIDCKYIQVYFQNELDTLLKLYNEYKNRKQ